MKQSNNSATLPPVVVGVIFCVIVVLAFTLRFTGLSRGLPDGTLPAHRSSIVGDENAILQDTLAVLRILRGDVQQIRTRQFYMQEGWLGHYTRLGTLAIAYLSNYIQYDSFDDRTVGGYDLINFRRVFLVARLTTVLASLAAVVAIALTGVHFFDRATGLLAALLFAVLPGDVVLSHFSKSNALAALMATLAFYFALRWQRTPAMRWAILAGIAIGLAAGARTNAILAGIPFVVALAYRWRTLPLRRLTVFALSAAAGCTVILALCYPHILVQLRLPDYGAGNINTSGFRWLAFLAAAWNVLGGWPGFLLLLLSAIVGVIYAFRTRDINFLMMFIWFTVYILAVAKTTTPQARYLVPVAPAIVLIVAYGIATGATKMGGASQRLVIAIVASLLYLGVAGYSVAFARVLAATDPALQAGQWIAKNVPSQSVIGKGCWEGDHYVPVDATQYEVVYSRPHPERPNLVVVSQDSDLSPSYIVLFDTHQDCHQFSLSEYAITARFDLPLRLGGIELTDRFPFYADPPQGWYDKYRQSVLIYAKQ